MKVVEFNLYDTGYGPIRIECPETIYLRVKNEGLEVEEGHYDGGWTGGMSMVLDNQDHDEDGETFMVKEDEGL